MNKEAKEKLKQYPKITLSKYTLEHMCCTCKKIRDERICGDCGDRCVEVVGRWKIKDFGPTTYMDGLGLITCGSNHKENIEFIAKGSKSDVGEYEA